MSGKKQKDSSEEEYMDTQEFRDAISKAVREGHKDQQKFMRENGYKDW